MEWLGSIYDLVKNNQLLVAVIGLSGAGILTFWLKDIPKFLYDSLKRELTTELAVTSNNVAFHNIMKWIENNHRNKNFRKLKLTNGAWGHSEKAVTGIGYGFHYIKYRGIHFLIDLIKDTSNQSGNDKDTLHITKLGRSRRVFDNFIKDIEASSIDLDKTEIYKAASNGDWKFIKKQKKRILDSIFIESYKKEMLIRVLSEFINKEQWYLENGIPYQLGILLYGAPGTGKTSLIKAVAGYLNYPIYYISPQELSNLGTSLNNLSDKCVVVIEDIDSNTLTHFRSEKNKSEKNSILENISQCSLSEILNSLDGIISVHGRILIATTNHIEMLDPALIRPGRIDLKLEIGFVNNEILQGFMNRFFPKNTLKLGTHPIKEDVTVAQLLNLLLYGKSDIDILKAVAKDNNLGF